MNANAESRDKLNCHPDKVYAYNKNFVLNRSIDKSKTQIYFLQNFSDMTLVVTHPMERVGASAGWYSYLSPGNWSAIFVSQNDFALKCFTITQQEKSLDADCEKVLRICQPNEDLHYQGKGDYWLVENQPWESFTNALEKRGVTFK